MAPLFGRKPKDDAAALQRAAEIERLRVKWEAHMARMPPFQSARFEFVEYRALAAEMDVQASRYIGAVMAGHGAGLKPPAVESQRQAFDRLASKASTASDAEAHAREVQFHRESLEEATALLQEAARLNAPPS